MTGIGVYNRELGAIPCDLALDLTEEPGLFISRSSNHHERGKPNVLGRNLMPSSNLEFTLQRGAASLLGELPTQNQIPGELGKRPKQSKIHIKPNSEASCFPS